MLHLPWTIFLLSALFDPKNIELAQTKIYLSFFQVWNPLDEEGEELVKICHHGCSVHLQEARMLQKSEEDKL